jgi:hypothetical protein
LVGGQIGAAFATVTVSGAPFRSMAFSNDGTSSMTQLCTLEWSTSKFRSAIIAASLRKLSEYAMYHRTHSKITPGG